MFLFSKYVFYDSYDILLPFRKVQVNHHFSLLIHKVYIKIFLVLSLFICIFPVGMAQLQWQLSMEQCNGDLWLPTQLHPKRRRLESLVPKTSSAVVAISKAEKYECGKWTKETMWLAIDAIHHGAKSIGSTTQFFSIPPSSIHNWLHRSKTLGHGTYLTKIEELALKSWCFKMQEVVLLVILALLKNIVSNIICASLQPHLFKYDIPDNIGGLDSKDSIPMWFSDVETLSQ